MKKPQMTAIKLRAILSVAVVIIIALSIVGFYFGQNWLRTLAVSVSHTVADSQASGNDVQSLKKLQENLLTRQDIINKANSIIASSESYQNQTIMDLDKYASDAGIAISNYNFAQPTTPAATTTTGQPAVSGLTSVTVTVASPLSYTKLMKFMTSIENNLPKMQISSINLGRVPDSDSDTVRTDQLTIEVYTQ